MYVRNCWYMAGWDNQVESNSFFKVTIIGIPLILFRSEDGSVVALEDRCSHRNAPLSKGAIENGCRVRCMYHGFLFDSKGNCLEMPGECDDRRLKLAKIKNYPVVDRNGWLWVWMGELTADVSLIPNVVGLKNPDFILRNGYMDFEANYELLNDNLTDFSHLAYVHTKSFGAGNMWSIAKPTVQLIDRGIRVSRWIPADETAFVETESNNGAYFIRATDAADTDRKIAFYQSYDYLVPGVLIMETGSYRASQIPEDGAPPPQDIKPLAVGCICQAVTPMTDRTSRYFFMIGPDTVNGSEEDADRLLAMSLTGYSEDREIIEAQQRNIDLRDGQRNLTSYDEGPVKMRAMIRKFILHESELAGE